MGGGPSKLDLQEAEQDRVMEEKRKAKLQKAHADSSKDMVHLKITEPRIERDGRRVGQSSAEYDGPEDGVKDALRIQTTQKQAIEYEAKQRAICDS